MPLLASLNHAVSALTSTHGGGGFDRRHFLLSGQSIACAADWVLAPAGARPAYSIWLGLSPCRWYG